jgi:hypothetical protein
MHQEVSSEHEAVEVMEEFDRAHAAHEGFAMLRRGQEWGIYLCCEECDLHRTVAIKNDAYQRAMARRKAGVLTY